MGEILDEDAQRAAQQLFEQAQRTSHSILEIQVKKQKILIGKLEKDIALKNRRVARRDAELVKRARIHQRELDAKDRRISRFIAELGHDIDGVVEINSTWQEDLKAANYSRAAIECAYKKACRINNQSCHPLQNGLVYISKSEEPELDVAELDEFASLMKTENTESLIPALLDAQAGFRPDKEFKFGLLLKHAPLAVAKIAKYVMMKEIRIHIIVRLDEHGIYPPEEGGVDWKTGLPFRFHWEGRSCAINSSPLARDVLAPLLVSRTWLEIFGTCFYANNTFSFQSLGEFGIFMDRVGLARRHRIQSVELWWIGSRMTKSEEYEHRKRYSMRTWALHLLTDLLRLKTLKLFVNESGRDRIRRRHEPGFVRGLLEKVTGDHENNRMRRDLRKALGTDWIYQLRGIQTFDVFDYGAAEPGEPIRDRSFRDDVRSQVMQSKSPEKTALAKIENLEPLIKSQVRLCRQVQMLLRHFLDDDPIIHQQTIYNPPIVGERVAIRGATRSRRPSPRPTSSHCTPPSPVLPVGRGATKSRRNFIEIKDEDTDVIMIDVDEEPQFKEIRVTTVKTENMSPNMRSKYSSSAMERQVYLARQARRAKENQVKLGRDATESQVEKRLHTGRVEKAAQLSHSPSGTKSPQQQALEHQMRIAKQARVQQQQYPTPQSARASRPPHN